MSEEERATRHLYTSLLEAWNNGDATRFAGLFTADGEQVGFDGSQVVGASDIAVAMGEIFADHATAQYVSLVRSVRIVGSDVAVLRAEVGMVPPEGDDVMEDRNAVQTMVAVGDGDGWRVTLFHNTPAQFHGRPEAVEALTAELRETLSHRS